MNVAVIIATRGRPALFMRAALSALTTAKGSVHVYVVIDQDEPMAEQYLVAAMEDPRITVLRSPSSGSSNKAFDWGWRQAKSDIIVLCGDDNIFRTDGWDEKAAAYFESDPLLMLSLNDGRRRMKLETICCTRPWAETVGFILDTRFEHFCADELVEKIAKRAGHMHYAMNIVLEHMHPKYGKGEWDETYLVKRTGGGNERDRARLAAMEVSGEIETAAERIRRAAMALKGEAEAT